MAGPIIKPRATWNPGFDAVPPLLSIIIATRSIGELPDVQVAAPERFIDQVEFVVIEDHPLEPVVHLWNPEQFCSQPRRGNSTHARGQGPGPLRNFGVTHATGTYVFFADSDDVILLDGLTQAARVAQLQGAEVCQVRAEIRSVQGELVKSLRVGRTLASSLTRYGSAWRYVFQKDFLENGGLHFPAAELAEDIAFLLMVCDVNPRFRRHNEVAYHHVARMGSLSNSPSSEAVFAAEQLLVHAFRKSRRMASRALALEWAVRVRRRRKSPG